ncbi:MAG: carboxylesterase family protein [Mucilaginibacter polytrichastri]|nr:carboxylesterase family protein [Mucilaginibacter polytrichastri]
MFPRIIPPVFAAILLFSLTACFTPENSGPFERVKVEGGEISGSRDSTGIFSFKGVPFAAPPVDSLRWKAPQPVKPWNGVRICDTFGPSPMQGDPAPFSMWTEEFLIPKKPISEDCLYLNVWTGAKNPAEKRAVLVWIYGGGFMSGGSAVPIYDGAALARQGIIVVSINYRVGIFGFFSHPELSAESAHNASGNYGLLDQIAALKWVKANISVFGGDPDKVTIAGQSAGSMSVNALVASPLAKGMFRGAIGQSGASFTRENVPLADAEKAGKSIAAELGASSVADLRKLPSEKLMKANYPFRRPVIDGYVLPRTIAKIFAEHRENKVNLLTGWNENEGLHGDLKPAEAYRKETEQHYGADAAELLRFYPATTDSIAAVSQANLARDQYFGVQNFAWANAQSAHGRKVFVYRFSRRVPATGEYVKYGAFHTGEVPYMFDNLGFVKRPWESSDRELAQTMSGYWVNFVKTGNPNGSGLAEWPAYSQAGGAIMNFDTDAKAGALADRAALLFLYEQMQK